MGEPQGIVPEGCEQLLWGPWAHDGDWGVGEAEGLDKSWGILWLGLGQGECDEPHTCTLGPPPSV